MIKINKKIIIYSWLAILGLFLVSYILFPETLRISNIASIVNGHYALAIIAYLAILCIRGLLLIPPLPVALASSAFFSPFMVFLVNSFGIIISSFVVYRFSQFLSFDEYIESKYHHKIKKIRRKLRRKEVAIIFLWSFIPFFQTDLIVYLSATLKIPIWKCILAVFLGTTLINAIFIYSLNFFLPMF